MQSFSSEKKHFNAFFFIIYGKKAATFVMWPQTFQ